MQNQLLRALLSGLRGMLRNQKRRKKSTPLIIAVLTVAVFGLSQCLEEKDAPPPPKGERLSCEISKVYDGDTVTASCKTGKLKIRVWGIDAPEMGQKPWGEKSRDVLRSLLPSGPITIETITTDRYGRTVARLYDGERDLSLEMVRRGQAVVYERYNKSKDYKAAQAQAKREKLGIWTKRGDQQNPEAWRRVNKRS